VVADPVATDHVAVYQAATGHSLTIRREGGDFAVDLTSLVDAAEKTWIIAVYAPYAVGFTTTGVIRAYELDPTDEFTVALEKGELVVLGKVVIPASSAAPIPSGNITAEERTFAWSSVAREVLPWAPLIRNYGFEWSDDDAGNEGNVGASLYWEREGNSDGNWITDLANVDKGSRAVTYNYSSGSPSSEMYQWLHLPIVEGQIVRLQIRKKTLQVITGGSAEVFVEMADADGGSLVVYTMPLNLVGVEAAFSTTLGSVAAGAGLNQITRIGIRTSSITFGAAGLAFALDNMQAWLEVVSIEDLNIASSAQGSLVTNKLTLIDSYDLDQGTTPRAGYFEYDSVSDSVYFYDKAGDNLNTVLGNLTADAASVVAGATLGTGLLGSAVNGDTPRVIAIPSTFAGVEYTLMWESIPSGDKAYRKYISPTGTLVETVNATYSNTTNNWTKDDNAASAYRVNHTEAGLFHEFQTDAVDVWIDSAWTSSPFAVTSAGITRTASGVLTATTLQGQLDQLRDGVHGTKYLYLPAGLAQESGANDDTNGPSFFPAASAIFGHGWRAQSGGSTEVELAFPLHSGDRIIQLQYYLRESASANDIEVEMYCIDPLLGSDSTIGGSKKSGATNDEAQIVFDFATDGAPWPYTLLADRFYGASIQFASTASLASFIGLRIEYDHPA
jgi:hypothetical protein